MTLIKICGITSLDDALCSVEAGADLLGFNFYPPSPRYIAPELAAEIIKELPASMQTVGVFVNEMTPSAVIDIAIRAGVNSVQLHGDESPEFCSECSGFFVIKTFAVGPQFESQSVRSYTVDAVMLDAHHTSLRGGTGCRVDWEVGRQVANTTGKLFLAGGLSPENVGEAIRKVQPYAVDVCSSLERAPGKKDHDRVRSFINNVRETGLLPK